MKTSILIVLCVLSVTINGTWWVGFAQPILLSFGAAFAALNLDLEPILNVQPIELKKWLSSKIDEKTKEKLNDIIEEDVDMKEVGKNLPVDWKE